MELIEEAAEIIFQERTTGSLVQALPAPLALKSERIAYEIQDLVHQKMAEAGAGPVSGYKIGCTTKVMQEFLSIDQPCAGSMNECQLLESGARFSASNYIKPAIECEIAVIVGEDIRGGANEISEQMVADSVAGVLAAIEYVDDRYDDFSSLGVNRLIADDFFNVASIAGEARQAWQDLDLRSLKGRGYVNGSLIGEGFGRDILGHPLNALLWLANKLAERGKYLKAGDRVTLGSVVETYWVNAGEHIIVEFDGLAPVELFVDLN